MSLQLKLFIMSLMGVAQALYQLIFLHKVKFRYFAGSEGHCNIKHVRLVRSISIFSFYYDSACKGKTILDFANSAAIALADPIIRDFVLTVGALGPRKTYFGNVIKGLSIYWSILDYALILSSILLFCLSFCTALLGRKGVKYIIIPWISLSFIIAINDIVSIAYMCYIYTQYQKPSVWILWMGYSPNEAKSLKVFDKHSVRGTQLYHCLTWMPLRYIIVCIRLGIAIPFFIASGIILTRVSAAVYRRTKPLQPVSSK